MVRTLEDDRERQLGEASGEGYERIPQDTPDEWGDLRMAADDANRETLCHLDTEEHAAGFDTW